MKLLTLVYLLALGACNPPQETLVAPRSLSQDFFSRLELKDQALWLVQSDYQQGILSRLPFTQGQVENLRPLQFDNKLVQKNSQEIYVLTRWGEDSLALLSGAKAHVVLSAKLPANYNASAVTQDDQGKIWLAGWDSNSILALDGQGNQLGEVDISGLRDEVDAFAEPQALHFIAPRTLLVAAQRVKRAETWIPHRQSGLGIIDTEKLTLEQMKKLELTNALTFLGQGSSVLLIGSGELTPSQLPRTEELKSLDAQELRLSLDNNLVITNESRTWAQGRILAAGLTQDGKRVALVWWREQNRSCVEVDGRDLYCQNGSDGYLFSSMVVQGKGIFLSLAKEAALVALHAETGESQKISLSMPAVSLSFGP